MSFCEDIESSPVIFYPEFWQLNLLEYVFKKKVFPSYASYRLGYNKIETTRVLQGICSEHLPRTMILEKVDSSIDRILSSFEYPFICKTPKSSMGRGVFLIENEDDLRSYVDLHEILYVQEYIECDKDLRIVIIGKKVLTSYWRVAEKGEFRNNMSLGADFSLDELPLFVISYIESLAQKLGIDHAGFDIIVSGSNFYILEINTKFGTQVINDLQINMNQAIYNYLIEETMIDPSKPFNPRPPGSAPRKMG